MENNMSVRLIVTQGFGQDGNVIYTGHGWNNELTELIETKGTTYARENFRFSLIEIMPMSVDKNTVIARESHWKKALLSIDHGYNLQ